MQANYLERVNNLWRLSGVGKRRFDLLFFSLLLTIGGSTLFAELRLIWIHRLLLLLNLLVLLTIIKGRRAFRASVLLFFLTLFSTAVTAVSEIKAFATAVEICAVMLLILGTGACFRSVFQTGRIDNERIFASLSLYLLSGVLFALIFAVLEEFMPGSFHYPDILSPDTVTRPLLQYFYFSFVTLATLGYGDIVPVSGPAKGLAILEAMVGQMYLVVVVSRLVSLYGQSESRNYGDIQ